MALWLLAGFFVVAGLNHFVNPDFYVGIMPPYLPAHRALVFVSGVFEVLGGVGVLVPAVRSLAGWGLILLLMAVYPANIHMALHPEQFPSIPAFALYARLPLQLVFIAWTYWATRPGHRVARTVPATTLLALAILGWPGAAAGQELTFDQRTRPHGGGDSDVVSTRTCRAPARRSARGDRPGAADYGLR